MCHALRSEAFHYLGERGLVTYVALHELKRLVAHVPIDIMRRAPGEIVECEYFRTHTEQLVNQVRAKKTRGAGHQPAPGFNGGTHDASIRE